MNSWICCQIGAREHYAIPRALHRHDQLSRLLTDAWVPPKSLLSQFPKVVPQSIRDRYHTDLPYSKVKGFNPQLAAFEITHKVRQTPIWPVTIERNKWFQHRVIEHLEKTCDHHTHPPNQIILFTYSYAALHLLRYAKSRGWKTVLGQIDPGLEEEEIVTGLQMQYPELATAWEPAPPQYWNEWQQECALADHIAVNSQWSKQALQKAGVSADKIDIVPLAYSPPPVAIDFQRSYPDQFSHERPLRVLFLGQVLLRKGIAALLEAAMQLENAPVEFWIVGPIHIDHSQFMRPNIRWLGTVPRSEVAKYYQQSDVFLFPTFSDGFGLTQLEAQSWQLPIISSEFCGGVVTHDVNGLILKEISCQSIKNALQSSLQNPSKLLRFSQSSYLKSDFSLSTLSHALKSVVST